MRFHRQLLLLTSTLLLLFSAVFVGCEESVPTELNPSVNPEGGGSSVEKPFLTLSLSSLSFSAEAGEALSFDVSSNVDVTASTNASWLYLNHQENRWIVKADSNEAETAREDSIVLRANTLRQVVYVLQAGKEIVYQLSVDKKEVNVGASSYSESISIITNDSWTIQSSVDWVSVSPDSGEGDGTVAVVFTENTHPEGRAGTITITGAKASPVTIDLSQAGAGYHTTVDKSNIHKDPSSGLETFVIDSNDSWTAQSSVEWATLSSTSGTGAKTVTVNFSANTNPLERSGQITIASANSEPVIVNLIQDGVGYSTSVNRTSITSESSASNASFTITSNDEWTASSSVEWATLSLTSGKGNKSITVYFSENPDVDDRMGQITVCGAQSETIIISLKQQGIVYRVSTNVTSISAPYSASTSSFSITSNDSWVVESSVSWTTVSPMAGSGDKKITVSIAENTSSEKRYGTISVKGTYSETVTINLTQSGIPYGSIGGHGYVDLGLPSGTLWATANLGASSETGNGSYYLWTSSDRASSVWGSSWKMPTRSDYNELLNYCSYTWTTRSGVSGYLLTGPNGATIFFPAAGFKNYIEGYGYSGVQSEGQWLLYWTASLSSETWEGHSFAYALQGSSSSSLTANSTWNISIMAGTIRAIVK